MVRPTRAGRERRPRKLRSDLTPILIASLHHGWDSIGNRHLSLAEQRALIENNHNFSFRDRKVRLLLLLPSQAKTNPPRPKGPNIQSQSKDDDFPHIFKLPVEIQLLLLDELNFWDIRNFRQTCRYFHDLFNSANICLRFGGSRGFRAELDSYCCVCHRHAIWDPSAKFSLAGPALFRSSCWYCDPGNCFCKWCGYDIKFHEMIRDFHRGCFRKYLAALWGFYLLGWVQLLLTVGGFALAWRYYKGVHAVIGPATVSSLSTSSGLIDIGLCSD